MAIKMQEIAIPLSEFYIGATTLVPTSTEVKAGTRIELDAKGVPTAVGWKNVGATIGEGSWEFSRDTIELEIEQVSGIPDGGIIYNNDSLTLTIPVAQMTADNLDRALQGDVYAAAFTAPATVSPGKIVTLGGKSDPETFSVLLIAEHRAGKGIYHQFCMYKCISSEGTTLSFSKADATTFEIQCRGLIDVSRDKGDQLGYCYIADIPAA